jgi:hypothetical protein
MVRERGFEPLRISPLDPKSRASASSATLARDPKSPSYSTDFLLPGQEKFFSNLLRDKGGVPPGSVVDENVHPHTFCNSRPHQVGRLFNHLRLQHSLHHFIERLGFENLMPCLSGLSSHTCQAKGLGGHTYLLRVSGNEEDPHAFNPGIPN